MKERHSILQSVIGFIFIKKNVINLVRNSVQMKKF